MTKEIYLDIESDGLFPWQGDRVTCICAKNSDGEWFKESMEDERMLLRLFITWLKVHEGDWLLVTKNGKGFDIPFINTRLVINGFRESFYLHLTYYPHFDLHTITKKWISLDDMARILGCKLKSGTGKNAIKLWKERRLKELVEYCARDVEVTEEVYRKHKELVGGE